MFRRIIQCHFAPTAERRSPTVRSSAPAAGRKLEEASRLPMQLPCRQPLCSRFKTKNQSRRRRPFKALIRRPIPHPQLSRAIRRPRSRAIPHLYSSQLRSKPTLRPRSRVIKHPHSRAAINLSRAIRSKATPLNPPMLPQQGRPGRKSL